jgi:RNA polymerase sigma-70 factor (ECF subfamily)
MPDPGSRPTPAPGAALGPEDFARRFGAAARVLWTVAAGVVGDAALADDVLQEAALIGLEKREQFEPGTRFTAWMARIVRFVALNQLRSRARRPLRGADPAELADARDAAQPTGVTARGALTADAPFDDELCEALRALKPTARACLLLKTVLELEYAEIARTLEIPAGTAMSHVHRARAELRRRLAATHEPLAREA